MTMNSVLRDFFGQIERSLKGTQAISSAMPAIKDAMKAALCRSDLLDGIDLSASADSYRRNLIYVDTAGRFSLLALIWAPGQYTPVHAHNAWGVVGVYRGRITEARFVKNGDGLVQTNSYLCKEREVSIVEQGIEQMHRLVNISTEVAVTLHCYGLNLREDPGRINIVMAE